MIGIYKITSPSVKIYIGQSINIEKRFARYKTDLCKNQIRLNSSFIKYGVLNHSFEIVCECLESELNDKERYYQDLYQVISKKGLNCRLTKTNDRSGSFSEESRIKMSRKPSEETRAKLRKACENRVFSESTRKKISESNKNKVRTEVQRSNHSKRISKLVLCIETGVFHDSAQEAAATYDIKYKTLVSWLQKRRINKSSLIYA